jgi:hypothetical protein
MRGFVRILKTPPTAYVVRQDHAIFMFSDNNVTQKVPQSLTVTKYETAARLVTVGLDDLESVCLGIVGNRGSLIVERVLLTFSGRAEVLGCGRQWHTVKFDPDCCCWPLELRNALATS